MTDKFKIMIKEACPHCGKNILIDLENEAPRLNSVLTEGDVVSAKMAAIRQLENIDKSGNFDKKLIKDAIEWINEEETIFGPDDVKSVVDSVIN